MQTTQFDPGRAKHRVRIQRKSVTRNAIGEEVIKWRDVVLTGDKAVWAEAWPLKGREFFASQQTQYAADVRFRIRYRSDITREHRVMWNSEPYDIVQIIDVGAGHHTTEILALNGIRNGSNA
jgi:SPP1 family predicted phage head-tail adaptor